MSTAQELIDLASALATEDSSAGFMQYLRHVVIDSRPEPRRFSSAAFPWQWGWASQLAPALEDVCGLREGYTGPRCFWRTLARGHDKTTGLARGLNYVLAFGRRPVQIDAGAADWEQAALILAAMQREVELNPWMKPLVAFHKKGARGTRNGAELTILTSDAPTAAGRIPDLIICDEVTHWEKRDLFDMLFSSANKRPATVVIVLTNAGVKQSWQWDVKEAAKTMPRRWLVYEAPGRLQTWMSEENIEQDRKLLTPSEARRLLDNHWIDPAEESGYLSLAHILGCEDLGRTLGLIYAMTPERGADYWAGIDYGPRRDRTVLSLLHQRPSGLLVVDRLDVWQGSPEAEVQIADIRVWIRDVRAVFGNVNVVVDPYQLKGLVQDLRGSVRIEEWESRGGKKNYEMAECLRGLVVNQGIAWYPGCGGLPVGGRTETLADELASLVTVPMAYGYRIDHLSTKHDDRAVAVGMACVQILRGQPGITLGVVPKVETPPPTAREAFRPRRISAEGRGLYGMK